MTKLFKTKKFLLAILILAAVLRLWRLGVNPPHLTPDEAALGYNAYSILKTARDEYGQFLPLIFKSFGDYKPGLYVYASVPTVALFGLTEFAVRLPSALAGVAAVWFLYKITDLLFSNQKKVRNLPLISGFLLAISPWHIHFSRGAWEINLSLTLTLAGIYFFLIALKKQKYLLYSALFFGLTLFVYQGAKLSSAIVVLILVFVYRKHFFQIDKRILIKSTALGLLISVPIILSLFQGKAGRLKVFSVFSYRRPEEYLIEQLAQGSESVGEFTYYIAHSEVYNIARGIAGRWFNHFSGRFLFFEGDWQNPRHSSPNHGVLLISDMIFLPLGVYFVAKKKSKGTGFIVLWLLLSPLSSALSRDQVHAVRAFNMIIPLTVATAFAVTKALESKKLIKTLAVGIYISAMAYFLDSYFIHLPSHNSQYWEYGYKQAIEVVEINKHKYEKVHFRQSFAQPYMYYLFHTKYPPAKYQKQANLIESEYGDVGRVESIDNIFFLPIDWTVNRGDSGTLFVADPIRIPPEDSISEKEFEVLDEIYFLDDKNISQRIVGVKRR